ncbi:hypothetical protein BU15DRAFT_47788, partial [Melanogaster broomeanus]
PPTPATPTPLPSHHASKLSPIVHTPTQFSRFLKHAEKHLGVSNVTSFEASLHLQDIGPDILPDVSDQTLKDVGMSTGDIIRLKKGSITWWNGPDVKRKHSDTVTDLTPVQKIAYEKRYHEGGASRFSGGPMRADDDNDDGTRASLDYDLFYRSNEHAQWLPVPKGFIVDDKGDEDPFLA